MSCFKSPAVFFFRGIFPANLRGTSPQYSQINLGWCKTMDHVGSMVHEIGHAIGMNHEQKRGDAAQAYEGHGPHLIMHWQLGDETSNIFIMFTPIIPGEMWFQFD